MSEEVVGNTTTIIITNEEVNHENDITKLTAVKAATTTTTTDPMITTASTTNTNATTIKTISLDDNNNVIHNDKIEQERECDKILVEKEGEENKVKVVEEAVAVVIESNNTAATSTTTATTNTPSWNYSNRKVMIQGVMKYHDTKAMKKLVDRWILNMKEQQIDQQKHVEYDKLKKPNKVTWMVITMKEEWMVPILIRYVNDKERQVKDKAGNRLYAKLVTERDDDPRDRDNNDEGDNNDNNNNRNKRRNNDNENSNNNNNKRSRHAEDDKDNNKDDSTRRPVTDDEIKNRITPFWIYTKEKQLDIKCKEMIKKSAMKIINEIKHKFIQLNKDKNRNINIPLYPWIQKKSAIHVNPIISAPTPLRNKSEFTFGYQYLFDNNNDNNNNNTMEDEKIESKNVEVSQENHDENIIKDQETITMSETIPSVNIEIMEEEKEVMKMVVVDEEIIIKKNVEGEIAQTTNNDVDNNNDEITKVTPVTSFKCVPACGFMVTGWSGGVCSPNCCSNIPTEHCQIVTIMNDFIQNNSQLPIYDSKTHCGFWRLLTVRTSRRTNECMIIIQHTPPSTGGEGNKDKNTTTTSTTNQDNDNDGYWNSINACEYFTNEKEQLIHILQNTTLRYDNDHSPIKITSLFFQEFGGVSSPPVEHPLQVKKDHGVFFLNVSIYDFLHFRFLTLCLSLFSLFLFLF